MIYTYICYMLLSNIRFNKIKVVNNLLLNDFHVKNIDVSSKRMCDFLFRIVFQPTCLSLMGALYIRKAAYCSIALFPAIAPTDILGTWPAVYIPATCPACAASVFLQPLRASFRYSMGQHPKEQLRGLMKTEACQSRRNDVPVVKDGGVSKQKRAIEMATLHGDAQTFYTTII